MNARRRTSDYGKRAAATGSLLAPIWVRTRKIALCLPILFSASAAACSTTPAKSPDITANLRSDLERRGLKDVSVAQDRDTGVVTLSGKVPSEDEKSAAASLAQTAAPGQVVANQIMVTPPGMAHDATAIHDAIDDGIESNLKAMMIRIGSPADVKYSVTSAVVTLTGTVNSQQFRNELEKEAANVANVKQVVNELQVQDQKATTRRR